MPVLLPSSAVLPTLRPLTDDEVLTAPVRTTGWRFELLDRREVIIGRIDAAVGGSVDWTANASIKGGGSITVTGQDIDWLNVRVRPVATITGLSREVPCGVWLASAPREQHRDGQVSWEVELLDKASILAQSAWTHPTSGRPETFAAAAGSNVLELVKALIADTGEAAPAIGTDTVVLARQMLWEPGTTRLKIINDLLDTANYFSLWVDMRGQFRADRYVRPQDRAPLYEAAAPLIGDGPTSILSPDLTVDRDIYSVPNRVIIIGQGDGDAPPLTGVAVNTNPDSPFSTVSRGRTVDVVETGFEGANQQAFDDQAYRRLVTLTSVAAAVSIEHVFLPDLTVNAAVRLGGGWTGVATVQKTTIRFDPLALCSTDLREVPL